MNTTLTRRDLLKTGAFAAAAASAVAYGCGQGPVDAQTKSAPAAGTFPPFRVSIAGNENPHGPSAAARRAVVDGAAEGCRYPDWREVDELKRRIAAREKLTPAHVVLGAGSSEILCMAAALFANGGGPVVAPEPTFGLIARYAQTLGASIERVPLDERFEHDLEEMDRRTTRATRLVYVCNPNNPTSTLTPRGPLRSFVKAAARRAPVLVDEAYVEYLDDAAATTLADLVRDEPNVLVTRTFSKIYGLAGLRVGYALAHPDVAARLDKFRMGILGRLGVRAALASVDDAEFVRSTRAKTVEARDLTLAALSEMKLEYATPHANFVWVRMGTANRDLPAALARRGMRFTWDEKPLAEEWARISIGTLDEMRAFTAAMRAEIAT